MAKPEWGVKRACPHCTVRFYDLARDPIVCPNCNEEIDLEALLKPKRGKQAAETETEAKAAAATATEDAVVVDDDIEALVVDDEDDDVGTFTDDALLEDDDDDNADLGIDTGEVTKPDDDS